MHNLRCVRRLPVWPAAALALILAGCASQPPEPTAETKQDPRIEQAREAAAAGRSREAIKLFEAAANDAEGDRADRLWLRVGLLHARDDERLKARQSLVRVDPKPTNATVRALRQLLEATLRLPDEAASSLTALEGDPPDALPDDVREYWLASQARALAATDQPMAAARVRQQRQGLLTAGARASANRNALWGLIMDIPMASLREAVPARPDTFGGWLELGHAIRTNRLDTGAMRDAVDAWYERYPEHPAQQTTFAEIAYERAAKQANPPERIAVLLPLSGRLESVGQAVQNGLMTAYYASEADTRPELIIYDVGEDGRDPGTAYEEAVERGVDLVVGPLTKPAVEAVSQRDDYPVPVLALNRVQQPGTGELYQFGLAPEDDAREAARLMQDMGWRNVVALTPNDNWGMRILDTFLATYEEGDRGVLETARYRRGAEDFSDPIKAILNLDASEDRYYRLRRTLQRSLKFEPRRRRDVDAIFMGAFPEAARLIKPQIRFHRGIGIPVVATSHAYNGFPRPDANKDIDNLIVVDTPWTLGSPVIPALARAQDTATSTWPAQARRHPRLMALGVDAFRLAGPVDVLAEEPTLELPGLTGSLSVDADRLIHRQLRAGRFRDGLVTPLIPLSGARPSHAPRGSGSTPSANGAVASE
jgi:outer membrane PBP1 activator LpoA protein